MLVVKIIIRKENKQTGEDLMQIRITRPRENVADPCWSETLNNILMIEDPDPYL
jgi:hypothetical protein